MASSSTTRRDFTGFLVLLAFFLLAGFILTRTSRPGPQTASVETVVDPSIDNTRASGSRGLYEWTERLGYRPRPWRHDFMSLPDDAKILFCIAPVVRRPVFDMPVAASHGEVGAATRNTLTPAEGRAVREWVSRGHTLVLFASTLPASEGVATPPPRTVVHRSAGNGSTTVTKTTVTYQIAGRAAPSFANEIGIDVESALGKTRGRMDFGPMQPSTWTEGVDTIRIHPGMRLYRAADNGMTLFGDVIEVHAGRAGALASLQAQPVAMIYSIGRGHIVAVADDEFACNANICRAENAQFIYRILKQSAGPGAAVLFDEFHRDFGGESPSLWAALGRPLQFATVQLLLAALIALIVLAPRLGRPEPLARNSGRTSAEYVTSLAGLYRSAGATATALDTVYRQFLREICTRYGLPTDVTLDRLAETASRRGGVNGSDLRKLLIACERALESKASIPERDMITLVRAIERFRKELGIG